MTGHNIYHVLIIIIFEKFDNVINHLLGIRREREGSTTQSSGRGGRIGDEIKFSKGIFREFSETFRFRSDFRPLIIKKNFFFLFNLQKQKGSKGLPPFLFLRVEEEKKKLD